MQTEKPNRPIVRYHGGKWLLAPWIIQHFPKHKTYVEPYGGGGSVLLCKSRSKGEIYNDLDTEIVNVFTQARDNGQKLKELLRLTPFAREEFNKCYEHCDDPIERARRTIARSFMCFGANGISAKKGMTGFRAASRSDGTMPANDWKNYADVFDGLINRLRGVVIENRPALEVMASHDSDETLHYVDPPYVLETRGDIRHGYKFEMDNDEHCQMAVFLRGLKGIVILSGYDSPLYAELFAGWSMVKKSTMADGAHKRVECLWVSKEQIPSLFNFGRT